MTVPIPETGPSDPRIGHLLGRALTDGAQPRAVIIGFPSDEGVRRNGGRVGAAAAPDEIRRRLYRLTPDPEAGDSFTDLLARTADLGNLPLASGGATGGDLETNQEALGAALAPHLSTETFVIVLGGGHETAYGHFLGYVAARRPVSILNWDAHADVRELKDGRGHSGSPFRQALEHPSRLCRGYRVAGLLPHSVAVEHLRYIETRREARGETPREAGGETGGRQGVDGVRTGYDWRRDLTPERVAALYDDPDGAQVATLASFDIDAVDEAHAPGVSAPACGGLTPELWLRAAYTAGRSRGVSSCDLVEMNPTYDIDGRTARLAALTIWWILKGLAERA